MFMELLNDAIFNKLFTLIIFSIIALVSLLKSTNGV